MTNDFLTRLKPGSRQVLIMTRWHEDDLAGRLLDREANKWRVITLPMIAEVDDVLGRKPGDRLWPDRFTDEMVLDAQRDVRSWNALYQQNPVPEEGNFFKKDWFIEYDDGDLPSTLHNMDLLILPLLIAAETLLYTQYGESISVEISGSSIGGTDKPLQIVGSKNSAT